jgi:ferredoxin
MRVNADRDRCCGAGMCAMTAPDVFDQRDDDGLVEVLCETPPPQSEAAVREAVSLCPSGAIAVVEESVVED